MHLLRLMPVLVCAACCLAVGAAQGDAPSQTQPVPAQGGPELQFNQAPPQQAFAALGRHHGGEFRLLDDQQWLGADSGVAVSADLRASTFWEGVQILSEQTGYEPVFRPYGRNAQGQPVIWLRRVDIRGEEKPTEAMAAGPLLIRAREARVTIDLRMASLRMTAPQAAVRVELFLEPKSASALYVTAAALRAFDEERAQLRRAEGHDPTTRIGNGIGELLLHLDAVKRIPTDVARWQAMMRVVEAKDVRTLAAPVTVVADGRRHGIVARGAGAGPPAPSTQGSTAPAAPQAVHELGSYRIALEAVRIGQREVKDVADTEPPGPAPQVATVQCLIPRGQIDPATWSRVYGFLFSSPPALGPEKDSAESPWRLLGYAVIAVPSGENADEAGAYRVWAQYEADAGTGGPGWLVWKLPVASGEQRAQVIWEKPMPIQPMAGAATQPASQPEALEPANLRKR